MSFKDYVKHYTETPHILYFFGITLAVAILIHLIIMVYARIAASKYVREDQAKAYKKIFLKNIDRYYEMLFSASSILLFTGIYFLIDFDYFGMSADGRAVWMKYQDFLLLGFIFVSIILNTILDRIFIPLKSLTDEDRGTLRLTGMLYMLIIFAYIKFIYEDNNYNAILVYFLTLVIGRFIYFDASLKSFCHSMKNTLATLPILGLVLISTALLAWYGFGSGYLLRSNGVVLSVFIAHFFLMMEVFVLARTNVFYYLGRTLIKGKESNDADC